MYVMGAGEPGSMRSEESAMDYAARNFVEFAALDDRVRTRLHDYFGVDSEDAAATKWLSFTAAHDDQAADVLAVARALSRVVIRPATDAITALELIDRFHLLAGDRLYARLSRPLFEAWKANASFQIELAGGGLEEGKVNFNHGQVGASLHDGFDIQGVTALNRIPRIQWNYRFCDALADIDLDGYSPWDLIRHPTYANSDRGNGTTSWSASSGPRDTRWRRWATCRRSRSRTRRPVPGRKAGSPPANRQPPSQPSAVSCPRSRRRTAFAVSCGPPLPHSRSP
jgi:hypothetical protein